MSQGTPVVMFRMPKQMLADILAVVHRRNRNTQDEPWTRTDFIRCAIREKLAKMARLRTRGRRQAPPRPGEGQDLTPLEGATS